MTYLDKICEKAVFSVFRCKTYGETVRSEVFMSQQDVDPLEPTGLNTGRRLFERGWTY